ncbi:MAG: CRISPR-associated endonuclease Cas3'' [Dehalococcoidia bacterium]
MVWAHSANEAGVWDPLPRHLRDVAALARSFGEPLGIGDLAYWAGLLHDLGKYEDDFQRRLHDPTVSAPHAAYGACVAVAAHSYEVAFAVAAHHAGLFERGILQELPRGRPPRHPDGPDYGSRAQSLRSLALTDLPELAGPLPDTNAKNTPEGKEALELRTRLLLSCLVDADRLDTEAFYSSAKAATRAQQLPSMGELADRVEQFIGALQKNAQPSVVNEVRAEVLRACMRAADAPPGLATLTVPTGGGKTLASLLYALRHAARHGLRRVIVVVPFLAIIEQNARVIRRALGEASDPQLVELSPLVLEHHSGIVQEGPQRGQWSHDRGNSAASMQHADADQNDPHGGPDLWRRLAAENWDAPVVITTAVQFLESLFTSRPSRARKLHRIAGSVVIFDEVQTVPAGLLQPILRMLGQFQREYGSSFLFCTATQPAFEERPGGPGKRWPAGELREVAPDPASLFRRLKRVEATWPEAGESISWADLAHRLAGEGSALAIVNTRNQARDLYEATCAAAEATLSENPLPVLHLSSRLCPQHRTAVLRRLREAMHSGSCLLIATQLVEAGVDLDFPALYRAFGPLDSIAQAAGRCNREGRLHDSAGRALPGRLIVFQPEDGGLPQGLYRTATDTTQTMLREMTIAGSALDLDDPELYRRYFDRLYNVANLDVPGISGMRQDLSFRQVDEHFRVIDDDTQGVVVPYGDGVRLINGIRNGWELNRGLLRRLQPFTVNLYRREFERAVRDGTIEEMAGGTMYAARPGNYDETLGFSNARDGGDWIV